MREEGDGARGVPAAILRVQPDSRSCGACCLVAVRALSYPAYALSLDDADRWGQEVLATHRQVTSLRDRGRLGLPWPRALGTPPWAVSRRLRTLTGRPWRVRVVRMGGPPWREAAVAASTDGPAVLFVGTSWLPRHVTLVLGADADGLRVYDPARGAVSLLRGADRLGSATGWSTPWFLVERVH